MKPESPDAITPILLEGAPGPAESCTDETEGPGPHDSDVVGEELSPRQRRFAQLVAQGLGGQEIKAELGYSDSRMSVLRKVPAVAREIRRLQDRIFEETIQSRLKDMSDPALSLLSSALNDRLNRFKKSEQIDVAKWVIEKLDGKAGQKIDIGGSMLGQLMDKLDAMKTSGGAPAITTRSVSEAGPDIELKPKGPKTEEDLLDDWITDFDEAR